MRVAVAVRVDGAVEPGEQLVGARVDGVGAADVRLPAGDPDRQDRRARRDAAQAAGAARADEQPGQLGAVALDQRRVLRVGRARSSSAVVSIDVDARQHAAAQERMGQVDAGVEQRDRDAAPVEARQVDSRAAAPAAASDWARPTRRESAAGNAARTG